MPNLKTDHLNIAMCKAKYKYILLQTSAALFRRSLLQLINNLSRWYIFNQSNTINIKGNDQHAFIFDYSILAFFIFGDGLL